MIKLNQNTNPIHIDTVKGSVTKMQYNFIPNKRSKIYIYASHIDLIKKRRLSSCLLLYTFEIWNVLLAIPFQSLHYQQ